MANILNMNGSATPSTLLDCYGRALDPGDQVVMVGSAESPKAPIYTITEIRPNLHPQAQPGTLLVTLSVSMQVMQTGGRPTMLAMVKAAEERVPGGEGAGEGEVSGD